MVRSAYSRPLDLRQVRITDEFWGREQELVRGKVIPYQWEALNDRIPGASPSFSVRNFKLAGRMMSRQREKGEDFVAPVYTFRGFEALPDDPKNPDPDKFYGFVFQDSDLYKWIEAVGHSLAHHPDSELERTADEAIDMVCAAQAENGYLNTYYIINGMDRIFTNLRDHHELYCFGHLTEGAISYYRATGKDKLLNAVRRYADFLCEWFGPGEGQCKGYPGHEIAEMALASLYELTGEEKYLELCGFFLDERGRKPYYFDLEEMERAAYEGRVYREPEEKIRYAYHQAHLPVREQTEAVGHAVRAVYLYSGMADMARLKDDESLYKACRRLWDSIVKEKLYITGGIGATHMGEAFSFPYDLPNDTAYSETCAAIGLAFFARRMLEIEADAEYGDVMEQALYNTVLAGMAQDGQSFFYVNPLEALPEACRRDERKFHVKNVRQKWFGCACCPPNIARIISSLGAYVYTANDSALYTHLYIGSRFACELGGEKLEGEMYSGFPWNGKVDIDLRVKKKVRGTLAFRIPGWCRHGEIELRRAGAEKLKTVTLFRSAFEAGQLILKGDGEKSSDGQKFDVKLDKGYLYMTGSWEGVDHIALSFPMDVRMIAANEKVRENIGKAAFTRGPLCYCLEEADNGKDLHLLKADLGRLLNRECGGLDLQAVKTEMSAQQCGEMCVLKVPGLRLEDREGKALYEDFVRPKESEVTLTLVPYYFWNNRGEGEMQVWVRV